MPLSSYATLSITTIPTYFGSCENVDDNVKHCSVIHMYSIKKFSDKKIKEVEVFAKVYKIYI